MTTIDPDADALFDQYARERNAETALSIRPAITDEYLDAMLDRRERRRLEREQQAELARLRGGPCGGCGQTLSIVQQLYADEGTSAAVRSELIAYWRPCQNQTLCFECTQLLGTAITLDDLKGAVAYDLLPPHEQRYWMHPALAARVRHLPILWAEHPGLPTRDTPAPTAQRFGWVDTTAILAAIAPPKPYRHEGPPCPKCGRTDAWAFEPSTLEAYRGPGSDPMMNVPTTPGDRCVCGHFIAQPGWQGSVISDSSEPVWLGGNLGSLDPLNPAKAS